MSTQAVLTRQEIDAGSNPSALLEDLLGEVDANQGALVPVAPAALPTPVEPTSPVQATKVAVTPRRPDWMADDENEKVTAGVQKIADAFRENPNDMGLVDKLLRLGEASAKTMVPFVGLYEKNIASLMDTNQTGSPVNQTLLQMKQTLDLVNPATIRTNGIARTIAGFALPFARKIPGAQDILNHIYAVRESVQSTVVGLERHLFEMKDGLESNLTDIATVYEGLHRGQEFLERDIYIGELLLVAISDVRDELPAGSARENVEHALAELTSKVIFLRQEDGANQQFFAGAQLIAKLTRGQITNITGMARLLRRSILASLGLNVAAVELEETIEITNALANAIGNTLADSGKRVADMSERMAASRVQGGINLDHLEAACKDIERAFVAQAKANQVIIDQGGKSIERLADISQRLSSKTAGGHSAMMQ